MSAVTNAMPDTNDLPTDTEPIDASNLVTEDSKLSDRRRSLPKPGARKLPSVNEATSRQIRRAVSENVTADPIQEKSADLKQESSKTVKPKQLPVRTRSLPVQPPSKGIGRRSMPAAPAKTMSKPASEPEKSDLIERQKKQIAELESQLAASWAAEAEAKRRTATLEEESSKSVMSAADIALFTAKERSFKTTEAKLTLIIGQKDNEIRLLETQIAKLEGEVQTIRTTSNEAGGKEALEATQLKARLEACKKRNSEQAVELGKFTAQTERMQELLDENEKIITNYREMIETQTSQLASLQGMYSNVQAELVSLKVFSNEQAGFVNNLNEENAKLVTEIQRLKTQADTRDRQLHESVSIAKKALLKQKEQNERLHTELKAAKSSKSSGKKGRK